MDLLSPLGGLWGDASAGHGAAGHDPQPLVDLRPACIICVALQEGQERGGVFALCASTVLALAGADFGYLSIAVLTFSAVFCAWLCRALFYHTLPSTALCCLGAWLVNETCIFLLRLLLGSVAPLQYLLVLLPGALLSLVGCPVFYYLSRQIAKLGD